jgi:KipI family sensor histidine kinase inhibitor
MSGPPFRVLPAGPRAALVEVVEPDAVPSLYRYLRDDANLPAGVEVVPAAATVLVDASATAFDGRVGDLLRERLVGWRPEAVQDAGAGPILEVPTVYDGADLADVAELAGLTVAEVVQRHTAAVFTVAFCGFAPGFGYLTVADPALHVPRRPVARTRVPAGSVALAGRYTGIYPHPTPGGWHLIGRTKLRVWDPARAPAALLAPGTRVRFRRVPE